MTKELIIDSLDGIAAVASAFVSNMGENKIFAFVGMMGAGKTTFIKAICQHLRVEDVVNSPTFSIINEYKNRYTGELIYHFDFYRIQKISEALDIGIEDYFYSGLLCFIEWPEIIKPLLPEDTVFVTIKEQPDNSRMITIY